MEPSQSRDGTSDPALGGDYQPLDHQGNPVKGCFYIGFSLGHIDPNSFCFFLIYKGLPSTLIIIFFLSVLSPANNPSPVLVFMAQLLSTSLGKLCLAMPVHQSEHTLAYKTMLLQISNIYWDLAVFQNWSLLNVISFNPPINAINTIIYMWVRRISWYLRWFACRGEVRSVVKPSSTTKTLIPCYLMVVSCLFFACHPRLEDHLRQKTHSVCLWYTT